MLLTNYKSVDSPLPQLEWKCAWARRQQTSAAGLGQTKNQKQQHQEHAQNDLAVCPPGCLDRARKNNELGAILCFKFGAFLAPNWGPVLVPKLEASSGPRIWAKIWHPNWAPIKLVLGEPIWGPKLAGNRGTHLGAETGPKFCPKTGPKLAPHLGPKLAPNLGQHLPPIWDQN